MELLSRRPIVQISGQASHLWTRHVRIRHYIRGEGWSGARWRAPPVFVLYRAIGAKTNNGLDDQTNLGIVTSSGAAQKTSRISGAGGTDSGALWYARRRNIWTGAEDTRVINMQHLQRQTPGWVASGDRQEWDWDVGRRRVTGWRMEIGSTE